MVANNNCVNIGLKVTSVYTLGGVKYLYRLSDMAYGEWLIYKNGYPTFYFNVFDEDYKDIKANIGNDIEEYLRLKLSLKGKEWSLEQKLVGIISFKSSVRRIDIEKLPKRFF